MQKVVKVTQSRRWICRTDRGNILDLLGSSSRPVLMSTLHCH